MSAAHLQCDEIIALQFGAIARWQALKAGLSARQIDTLLSTQRWQVILPGVYVVSRTASTWSQRAKAAELWGGQGSALSFDSSAHVWGLDGFGRGGVELSTIRSLRRPELIVHRVRPWLDGEVVRHRDLRVTSAERTLLDEASRLDGPRLEALVDEALSRGLTSEIKLDHYLECVEGRGRAGLMRLRSVVAARTPGVAPASPLETALARLLRNSDLPEAVRQYVVTNAGEFVARVDFAFPNHRVAIEAQSRLHHADKTSFERDLARMNALTTAGWTVIYVTWDDIHHRPQQTLTLIRSALRRAASR